MFTATHRIFSYDAQEFPFASWACGALRVESLEKLHERPDLSGRPILSAMEQCRTELKESFETCRGLFVRFFQQEIAPKWGCRNNAFQIPPTFRVHLCGCPTVSALHRDRDYGMPPDRLDLWLPLTRVWDNNTIWLKLHEDDETLKPIELAYGEYMLFDSANLVHGSFLNDTGSTRVSFDCRFTPMQAF